MHSRTTNYRQVPKGSLQRNAPPTHVPPPQTPSTPGSYASPDGGGGGAWCPPYRNDGTRPGCDSPVTPMCDVQMVGFREAAVAVNTPTLSTVAPVRTNYFQPLAIRLASIDGATPDLNRRSEIHSIAINGAPQDAFSNVTTVVGNTSVLLSDLWIVPEGWGVPVSWGIFAQAALIDVLQFGWLHRNAGVTVDLYFHVFGNPLKTCPAGYTPGTPFLGV